MNFYSLYPPTDKFIGDWHWWYDGIYVGSWKCFTHWVGRCCKCSNVETKMFGFCFFLGCPGCRWSILKRVLVLLFYCLIIGSQLFSVKFEVWIVSVRTICSSVFCQLSKQSNDSRVDLSLLSKLLAIKSLESKVVSPKHFWGNLVSPYFLLFKILLH